MKNNTVSFYTFGCRLNQSETAIIHNSLQSEGYHVVDFPEPSQIVVINTCTVTENGDRDTRRLINKVNRINPDARIALIGCQAQVQKKRLASLKNVKWVIGNARKMELASILKETEKSTGTHVITPAIKKEEFSLPVAGIDLRHTRANLKIQDGCDFFCSFCEIPYARGRARSRTFSDILKEAHELVSAGHQELVLTGINIGTYRNRGKSLIDVINALEEIPGLKRIRISSIEPTTIPGELLSMMADGKKLCRYLHIPLQSADDYILKKMKRKYTLNTFNRFIEKASREVSGICIGTDIIAGFPGEEQSHFNKTYEYLLDSPVHYCHVFSYSKRLLAKSKDYNRTVPLKDIRSRSSRLRELSKRKRRVFEESLLETTQTVLFEQEREGLWSGLTDNYVRIFVKSNKSLSNQIRRVKLNTREQNKVLGELI